MVGEACCVMLVRSVGAPCVPMWGRVRSLCSQQKHASEPLHMESSSTLRHALTVRMRLGLITDVHGASSAMDEYNEGARI